jgi:multiple sugar transport system permease protein
MAPPVAFTIPFFLAYRFLGLIDSLVGLVVIYLTFNLALVVWLMRNFFEGVPRALEEAAWIGSSAGSRRLFFGCCVGLQRLADA